MDLTTILFILSLPFVLFTVYFGTKNDFYESDNYKVKDKAYTGPGLIFNSEIFNGFKAPKESITKAIEIFPYFSTNLSKKKDANKADAILIASYFDETFNKK